MLGCTSNRQNMMGVRYWLVLVGRWLMRYIRIPKTCMAVLLMFCTCLCVWWIWICVYVNMNVNLNMYVC